MDWEPKFSVGIDEFDAAHMKLFDLTAEFRKAQAQNKGSAYLEILFESLEADIAKHFKAEEDAMKEVHYSGYEAHCQKHHDLQKQVSDLWAQHRDGGDDMMAKMIDFIDDWLAQHILNVDMGYRDSLSGKT